MSDLAEAGDLVQLRVGRPSARPRSVPARLAVNRAFASVASLLLGLALWQVIGSHYPYSMSSPWQVLRAARQYFAPQVLPALGHTLESLGLAFAINLVAGIPIGLAMARVRMVRIALEPYVTMFYSLPMLALFPLLILAFGINFPLRVAASVLFGIFAIIVNTYTGASRIDPALEDVGRSFVASGWKRLVTIIVPGSLDYIFAGVRVGFGHAMIGAVVIEMEASVVGVGSLLQRYAQNLQLGPFFVVVVVLGLFSILFSHVLRRLQHWATAPWERKYSAGEPATSRATQVALRLCRSTGLSAATAACASSARSWGEVALRATRPALAALRPAGRVLGSSARGAGRLATSRIGAWSVRIAIVAAIIAGWQIASYHVPRAVLPAPVAVAKATYSMVFETHSIFGPLASSLGLFASGFVLSLAIGIPVGLLMGRVKLVEYALDPYVSFLYALPIVVFVPVMVIWLGFGFNFGVAFVVVSAVFAVVINTMQGVHSVEPELVATARSFCARERTILRTVVLPSTVPFMIAGARMAFSISWIGVIVSEVLSSQTGLGGRITTYATDFEMPDMFVPILFIIAISVMIVGLSNRYAPRLTPWASTKP